MKNLIYLSALLLVLTFMGASCSSTEAVSEVVNNHEELYAQSPTIQQLKSINEEILKDNPKSRAWTNQQKKAIVEADVKGAVWGARKGFDIGKQIGSLFGRTDIGCVAGTLIGAVAGGSYSSWAVAPGTRSEKNISVDE